MGSLTLTVTLAPALARTRTRTVPLPLTKVCIVDSLADLLASQGVEGIDEMDADTDELLDALEEADGGGGYKVSPSLLVTRTNPYPNPSPDPDPDPKPHPNPNLHSVPSPSPNPIPEPTPTKISSSFVITDEAGEVVGVIAADCIGADGCSVSKTPAVREMLDRLFQDDAESDGPRGGA